MARQKKKPGNMLGGPGAPRKVGLRTAKAKLSELVAAAELGREVIILRRGKPVARLLGVEAPILRHPGAMRGRIWMADDFDDTPGDVIAGFEGRASPQR
jgi:prevent-host-death family protein